MRLIKNLSGPRFRLILSLLYTIFITVALLVPGTGAPKIDIPFLDKLVHIVMHAILVFVWLHYILIDDRYHFPSRIVTIALVLCFFYGIIIEALQHWFTTTRTFDLLDILANGIGDFIGLLSIWIVRKKIIQGS